MAQPVIAVTDSPFPSLDPAKKALASSRRLGAGGVARGLQLLAQADVDLRGGSTWPSELVLEVLVARLCRLAPRAASPARGR